jgi:hypothetical protein
VLSEGAEKILSLACPCGERHHFRTFLLGSPGIHGPQCFCPKISQSNEMIGMSKSLYLHVRSLHGHNRVLLGYIRRFEKLAEEENIHEVLVALVVRAFALI